MCSFLFFCLLHVLQSFFSLHRMMIKTQQNMDDESTLTKINITRFFNPYMVMLVFSRLSSFVTTMSLEQNEHQSSMRKANLALNLESMRKKRSSTLSSRLQCMKNGQKDLVTSPIFSLHLVDKKDDEMNFNFVLSSVVL